MFSKLWDVEPAAFGNSKLMCNFINEQVEVADGYVKYVASVTCVAMHLHPCLAVMRYVCKLRRKKCPEK